MVYSDKHGNIRCEVCGVLVKIATVPLLIRVQKNKPMMALCLTHADELIKAALTGALAQVVLDGTG